MRSRSSLAASFLGLSFVLACDLPPASAPVEGTVTASVVDPSDGILPRDGSVAIAVGGLLDPVSLYGADALIRSGDRELGVVLRFDPATRILIADPTPALLDPDLDYTLHVAGPRDFEGRPMETIDARFRVVRDRSSPEREADFDAVTRVLAGCRGCHEGPTAAMGLDVTDLRRTAIGVRSSEIAPSQPSLRIIEPGHPERSYLVYKMLGEGPIVGAPMGAIEAPDEPLPRAAIATITRWIARGAVIPDPEQP
jgi:hypothetical protein